MRYNVYLQTITYARKFFTNHEKNCTKNVHIITPPAVGEAEF